MAQNRGIRIGAVRGIPVYLTTGWIVISLAVAVMMVPTTARVLSLELGPAVGLSLLIPILLGLSVFAHEVGHGLVATRYSVAVREYVLSLWGGHTTFNQEATSAAVMAKIALAGPLTNGVIATLAWALGGGDNPMLNYLLWLVLWLNAVVMIFNLLPAAPLDGGRIIVAFFWKLTGQQYRAMVYAGYLSLVVTAALIGGALWWLQTQASGDSTWYLVAFAVSAMILVQGGIAQINQGKAQARTADLNLWDYALPTVLVDASLTLAEIDEQLSSSNTAVIVSNAQQIVGVVDPQAYSAVPPRARNATTVRSVTLAFEPKAIITASQGNEGIRQVATAAKAGHGSVILADGTRPPALLRVRDLAAAISDR